MHLENVFMLQPPSFIKQHSSSILCKLNKALYRFKQDPKAWFQKLGTSLQYLGFLQLWYDISLFLCNVQSSTIYLLAYVDDIIITSNNIYEINVLVLCLHAMHVLIKSDRT